MGVLLVFAGGCKKDDDKKDSTVPVLTTIAVTGISQTTAVSGGNITSDGNEPVSARGVCWSKSSNPTITDNKTSDGTGAGSFSSELSGLTTGETYYVRAYATNSAGTGYGSTMIFETLGSTFTDSRDGNVYKMVTIGDQLWMAENLRYLPSVVVPATGSNTTPYYYVYGYNGTNVNAAKATTNYTTYGVLYNWSASCSSCPPGWHLPSDAEWFELTDYLGGTGVAAGKLKETGTTNWTSPNTGATNETGFTALPGGYRYFDGTFGTVGYGGGWWSATEHHAPTAWDRLMLFSSSNVFRNDYDKEVGFSVRCVRD